MCCTVEISCLIFPHSFVVTVSSISVDVRLFRSYALPGIPEHDCTIGEAARATCAAPTYFSSIEIGLPGQQERFFDGGVGCNNPISQLHLEAARLFDDSDEVACIVSLGTGFRHPIVLNRPTLLEKGTIPVNLIKAFKKMALDPEKEAEYMDRKYSGMEKVYFRLNVAQGLQDTKLADFEKLGSVRSATVAYLRSAAVSATIDAIAARLCESKDAPTPSPLLGQVCE